MRWQDSDTPVLIVPLFPEPFVVCALRDSEAFANASASASTTTTTSAPVPPPTGSGIWCNRALAKLLGFSTTASLIATINDLEPPAPPVKLRPLAPVAVVANAGSGGGGGGGASAPAPPTATTTTIANSGASGGGATTNSAAPPPPLATTNASASGSGSGGGGVSSSTPADSFDSRERAFLRVYHQCNLSAIISLAVEAVMSGPMTEPPELPSASLSPSEFDVVAMNCIGDAPISLGEIRRLHTVWINKSGECVDATSNIAMRFIPPIFSASPAVANTASSVKVEGGGAGASAAAAGSNGGDSKSVSAASVTVQNQRFVGLPSFVTDCTHAGSHRHCQCKWRRWW